MEVAKFTAGGWSYLNEATGEYLPWSEYRKLKTGKSAAELEKIAAEDITLKASNFVISNGTPQWVKQFKCDSITACGLLSGAPDVEISEHNGNRYICTMNLPNGNRDADSLRMNFEIGIYASYYRVRVLDACINGENLNNMVCRADGDLKTAFVTKDAFWLNKLFSNIFDTPKEYRPIIRDTIKYAEVKPYYSDGELWQMAYQNGIGMAVSYSVVKDYGKWYKIELIVRNDSETEFEFDPVINLSAASDDDSYLKVWSSEEYMKKVKRAQSWGMAALALTSGLSAGTAGYSTYSGTVYNTYGTSYFSGTGYNAGAAFNANMQSQMLISEQRILNELNNKIKRSEYMKRNTVFIGQSIAGYILVKYRAGSRLRIRANISGAHFEFIWETE